MTKSISFILPAKNEAKNLERLLPKLRELYPNNEIIVVNDGSSDNTAEIARLHNCSVVSHPYSMGNGAAIKSGARAANGDILFFMDADGQHRPEDISNILEQINSGFDMVIGSRSRSEQASIGRLAANTIYNKLATLMVNHKVHDLTSGFRAVDAIKFREFLHLLPNGFSYPTTITMAFFRAGYPIKYTPIKTEKRSGKSHIKILRDGFRFFMIIFKVGTLYSPLKIFVPAAFIHFSLGLGYYLYTYILFERFTNMSALLLIASVIIFLIGLISEQITNLMYSQSNK